jgi:exosortase/archaeosortase family protein
MVALRALARARGASAWVVLAVAFGALEASLAWPLYADDYAAVVVVAWLGAVLVDPQARPPANERASVRWRAAGLAAALAALCALAIDPVYHAYDRLVPVVTGCGLAVAVSGPAGLRGHRPALLLLGGIPLLDPPLRAIRGVLDATLVPPTAWCATQLDRAAGLPMTLDAAHDRIWMPSGALHVLPGCSGALGITRLLVLAALVIALFPATARQKAALFASAVAIGFVLNVVRIAVMAMAVLNGSEAAFYYWHAGGGTIVIAVGTTAAAGLVWWLILRATSGAPGTSSSAGGAASEPPAQPDGSAAQC